MTDLAATRVREISLLTSSDSLTAVERSAYVDEVNSLINELESIASSTSVNDRYLLSGHFDSLNTQVGINRGEQTSASLRSARPQDLGAYETTGPTREALPPHLQPPLIRQQPLKISSFLRALAQQRLMLLTTVRP